MYILLIETVEREKDRKKTKHVRHFFHFLHKTVTCIIIMVSFVDTNVITNIIINITNGFQNGFKSIAMRCALARNLNCLHERMLYFCGRSKTQMEQFF